MNKRREPARGRPATGRPSACRNWSPRTRRCHGTTPAPACGPSAPAAPASRRCASRSPAAATHRRRRRCRAARPVAQPVALQVEQPLAAGVGTRITARRLHADLHVPGLDPSLALVHRPGLFAHLVAGALDLEPAIARLDQIERDAVVVQGRIETLAARRRQAADHLGGRGRLRAHHDRGLVIDRPAGESADGRSGGVQAAVPALAWALSAGDRVSATSASSMRRTVMGWSHRLFELARCGCASKGWHRADPGSALRERGLPRQKSVPWPARTSAGRYRLPWRLRAVPVFARQEHSHDATSSGHAFQRNLFAMHPVLATALAKICQERDEKSYSASLDAVSAIVRHFGEVNLAEVLFSEIPRTVPFELVAELFDLLAWQTNDNGASMARTTEAWLREGSDSRKLLIALHLEVYPFVDGGEMERVLLPLAKTNARVSARCMALIHARRSASHVG